jgi:sulfur-oxidizing protein SoxZ
MTEPTKIRAQLNGSSALVRVLMLHEMESGLRKDANGKTVAAWHIQTVQIRHQDKLVLTMHCGPAVAKNPYLQFSLRDAKTGDRVSVSWIDNLGNRRADSTTIA